MTVQQSKAMIHDRRVLPEPNCRLDRSCVNLQDVLPKTRDGWPSSVKGDQPNDYLELLHSSDAVWNFYGQRVAQSTVKKGVFDKATALPSCTTEMYTENRRESLSLHSPSTIYPTPTTTSLFTLLNTHSDGLLQQNQRQLLSHLLCS